MQRKLPRRAPLAARAISLVRRVYKPCGVRSSGLGDELATTNSSARGPLPARPSAKSLLCPVSDAHAGIGWC